jgi:hypothetical protein
MSGIPFDNSRSGRYASSVVTLKAHLPKRASARLAMRVVLVSWCFARMQSAGEWAEKKR